jgi:hypothetical protein
VKKLVDHMQRNDQAGIEFSAFGERNGIDKSSVTPPQGRVIEGHAAVRVRIS